MRSKISALSIGVLCVAVFYGISERYTLLQLYCENYSAPLERAACLTPYFEYLTRSDSAEYALSVAKDFQRSGIIDDCHVVAHAIGAENFHVYEKDPGMAFASCAMGCIDGCFHGVMEEYIRTRETGELDADGALSFCEQIPDVGLERRQCLHGVGHGLLRHSANALSDAVAACGTLPNQLYRDTCLGGVFMQNVSNVARGDEETFLNGLRTACIPVSNDAHAHTICTEAFGAGIMFYTGHDLDRTKMLCEKLDASIREQCVENAIMEDELHASVLET